MTSTPPVPTNPEAARILERDQDLQPWTLWGSYLPDRQWGTVREDYSADGDAWRSFPHDQARSRVYRWGVVMGLLISRYTLQSEKQEIRDWQEGAPGPPPRSGADLDDR